MTDQTPETTDPQLGDDEGTGDTPQAPQPAAVPELPEAPEDTPEDAATGYAVYDRVLARYVGAVTKSKPSRAEAKKLAGGHEHSIVRV